MIWDAMNQHNELQRRRELAKLSKVALIDTVIGFEHRAAERAALEAASPAYSSQAGLATLRRAPLYFDEDSTPTDGHNHS